MIPCQSHQTRKKTFLAAYSHYHFPLTLPKVIHFSASVTIRIRNRSIFYDWAAFRRWKYSSWGFSAFQTVIRFKVWFLCNQNSTHTLAVRLDDFRTRNTIHIFSVWLEIRWKKQCRIYSIISLMVSIFDLRSHTRYGLIKTVYCKNNCYRWSDFRPS